MSLPSRVDIKHWLLFHCPYLQLFTTILWIVVGVGLSVDSNVYSDVYWGISWIPVVTMWFFWQINR